MTGSLIKEISLTRDFLINDENEPEIIETIYIGGGTPSLLKGDEIKNLLEAINNNYTVADNAEITLEANPDDIDSQKLFAWKSAGINRLSIGIQSFHDKNLRWMNRAHDGQQAKNSIKLVRDIGFQNFSIDLIYGIPDLSDDEWKFNIHLAIENSIPHIACYALTVEPKTALQKMITSKKKSDVDPTVQARQFQLLMKCLQDADYEHYEISNFCKPGYRSKHNNSYWQGKKYLGIGPSAHSYNGSHRRWNVANNALYIQSIKNDKIPFEEEELTYANKLNEYIMTSLRTIEGIDLEKIEKDFSAEERRRIIDAINKKNYAGRELLTINKRNISLTDNGKLFADGIAAELFVT